MKIGFFSDMYLPRADGIAFSIETFRTELEAMGHEVYIFAPRPNFRYKEPSKRIIRFPAVKGLFFDDYLLSFYFPPQALRRIEKLKLDVIHYHTPSQIGLLGAYFALRNNIPLVTTYHTDLFEYVKHYPQVLPGTIALSILAPAITGGGIADFRTGLSAIKPERNIDTWNQKIIERGITMIHNHCDVVISPSRKIQDQLKSWKTKSRLIILPTGVDRITTNSREIAATRKLYGINPSDRTILFVGRIGTEKNLGLLISSFDLVAAKNKNAKLLIAGTGEDLQDFKDEAAKSRYASRIIFAGYVDHVKLGALYASSSVFAFPSLTDTQGLVINEAARSGLPIVMTDPTVTEVVRDGYNGYISKPDMHDFGAKLIKILEEDDRRLEMGRRSAELASEFSATNQAVKLLRLYEETIEQHSEKDKPTAELRSS
jgi:1,2-diacylglycerol 3-alpha-glucosyltransferase